MAELFSKITQWLDTFGIWLAVMIFISSLLANFQAKRIARREAAEAERRGQPIRIVLVGPAGAPASEQKTWTLPYAPRRDQLSRGELTGVIGVYFGKDRYDTKCITKLLESGELEKVLSGEASELIVPFPDDPTQMKLPSQPVLKISTDEALVDGAVSLQWAKHPSTGYDLLGVEMGTGLTNKTLVSAAEQELRNTENSGRLLLVDGKMSLPVAMVVTHHLAHRYAAIAMNDPKLQGFVVVISHDPAYGVGQLISFDQRSEESANG